MTSLNFFFYSLPSFIFFITIRTRFNHPYLIFYKNNYFDPKKDRKEILNIDLIIMKWVVKAKRKQEKRSGVPNGTHGRMGMALPFPVTM